MADLVWHRALSFTFLFTTVHESPNHDRASVVTMRNTLAFLASAVEGEEPIGVRITGRALLGSDLDCEGKILIEDWGPAG